MNNIDWVFFDVGGVLLDDLDYENARIDALHHVVHIFDSRVTRQQITESVIRASAMAGKLNDNILSFFISDQQKLQLAKNLMAGKRELMYENRGTVRPEAAEVLAKLATKYKIGLIANQPVRTRKLLEESGITEYITHFKVSDDHGLAKPDVRYFKAVLDECGTRPEKSLIVDDNIERGLLPAKRIGMTTVWFKVAERELVPADQIDFTVKGLNELINILA